MIDAEERFEAIECANACDLLGEDLGAFWAWVDARLCSAPKDGPSNAREAFAEFVHWRDEIR